jgi:16S rRNA (cytidine1402-2'-O)-methyltransferase
MGKLFIVSTPIGNLNDFSLRAQEVLKEVSVVVAENPGHSKKLMSKFGLGQKVWVKYAAFDEADKKTIAKILTQLQNQDVALVSDAGCPGICDPGGIIVQKAREEGFPVEVIPGPSSVIVAIQMAGFWESAGFSFYGFVDRLPKKFTPRNEADCTPWTHAFFLTPHQPKKQVRKLQSLFPSNAKLGIANELTKLHEKLILNDLHSNDWNQLELKGESVALVQTQPQEGKVQSFMKSDQLLNFIFNLYHGSHELTPRQFSQKLAPLMGLKPNELYQSLIHYKDSKKP